MCVCTYNSCNYLHANGTSGSVCLSDGRKFWLRFSGHTWSNFNLSPYCGIAVISFCCNSKFALTESILDCWLAIGEDTRNDVGKVTKLIKSNLAGLLNGISTNWNTNNYTNCRVKKFLGKPHKHTTLFCHDQRMLGKSKNQFIQFPFHLSNFAFHLQLIHLYTWNTRTSQRKLDT